MKKKGGQILRVGKEKVTPIFDGMLFPIGCANIPHNKQPIEHVLKIPISKPGDRDRPPLYRKVGFVCEEESVSNSALCCKLEREIEG
jgi:hypothetical protein